MPTGSGQKHPPSASCPTPPPGPRRLTRHLARRLATAVRHQRRPAQCRTAPGLNKLLRGRQRGGEEDEGRRRRRRLWGGPCESHAPAWTPLSSHAATGLKGAVALSAAAVCRVGLVGLVPGASLPACAPLVRAGIYNPRPPPLHLPSPFHVSSNHERNPPPGRVLPPPPAHLQARHAHGHVLPAAEAQREHQRHRLVARLDHIHLVAGGGGEGEEGARGEEAEEEGVRLHGLVRAGRPSSPLPSPPTQLLRRLHPPHAPPAITNPHLAV